MNTLMPTAVTAATNVGGYGVSPSASGLGTAVADGEAVHFTVMGFHTELNVHFSSL